MRGSTTSRRRHTWKLPSLPGPERWITPTTSAPPPAAPASTTTATTTSNPAGDIDRPQFPHKQPGGASAARFFFLLRGRKQVAKTPRKNRRRKRERAEKCKCVVAVRRDQHFCA